MPKRLSNEEKLKRMDEHNAKIDAKNSKELQKKLISITKTFIKAVNEYNEKNSNLISK